MVTVESVHKTILEKRNRKMKVTANQLRKIIIEEYIKEEQLTEADPKTIEDLLKQIQGDKYRPPEERDPVRYKKNFGDTAAMEKPFRKQADDTFAMDMDDDTATTPVADEPASPEEQIAAIVSGMDAEAVAEIFNAVFSKMQPDEEPAPETLYSPGAEGRPVAGFKLEELKQMIREMLAENV
jgi:hypothetical protein